MDNGVQVAQQAATEIEAWLRSLRQTMAVENVEDDPDYQQLDVDLLWTTKKRQYKIEIKGDRWHKTGNFFFETHSNKERDTPGCFMYTQADLLFYYFVEPGTLYILPMPKTRKWFARRIDQFEERSTTTPVGQNGRYTTVGRLVPIQTVVDAVGGVKTYQIKSIKE